MSYAVQQLTSPNRSAGSNNPIGVVLHHTAGASFEGDVSWILNPDANVSYHVVIAPDGRRAEFMGDGDSAWHAGHSKWRGRKGCNHFTLGVGFTGNTLEQPLTDEQIESFLEWFLPRAERYGWTTQDVVDHRIVTYDPATKTSRKPDLKAEEFGRVIGSIDFALEEKEQGDD